MPSEPSGSKSPPRTPIAFRVGVVGHRPNRLPHGQDALDALRRTLRLILEQVKARVTEFAATKDGEELYSNDEPALSAVSPLAEGADRMFAEQALDLGYRILCPMPFHQDEFEKDFLPPKALESNSLERFRALLARARAQSEGAFAIFELDGSRQAESAAYGMAGRVVLNQSDLLIAIWDGRDAAGGGGTVQTIREAVYFHVPVLWVHPQDPDAWKLLTSGQDLQYLDFEAAGDGSARQSDDLGTPRASLADVIKTIVFEELGLPSPTFRPDWATAARTHAARYFRERKPHFNVAVVWKLFRDAVGDGRLQAPNILVRDFESQISRDWPIRSSADDLQAKLHISQARDESTSAPTLVEDWVNRHLRNYYAWADKRGDIYADGYRSSYILVYLLSAMAVFVALLPMAADLHGLSQTISVATELAILLVIVLLLLVGSARHWHERWMEYRLLAELIRQVRILIPLGGGRPFPRVPAHLGVYGNLDQTWMHWQMRAIGRFIGIPSQRVTSQYLIDCLDYIGKVVGISGGGQLQFHQDTERRSERIWHRLHIASTALFVLTILSIAIHLLSGLTELSLPVHAEFLERHHDTIDRWLVLLAATLPALGAALAGIANQGEFARLAKRSAAMADAFRQFASEIRELRARAGRDGDTPSLSHVAHLAARITEVMVEEVSDWRVIVVEPPVRA